VRRSGTAWGVFVSQNLLDRLNSKATQGTRRTRPPTVEAAKNPAPVLCEATVVKRGSTTPPKGVSDNGEKPALDGESDGESKVSKTTWSMTSEDARRMAAELRHAYQKLSAADATGWLNRTLRRFAYVLARRVQNLAGSALIVTHATGSELVDLLKAVRQGSATVHLGNRLGHVSGKAVKFVRDVRDKATPLINDLRRDPANVAPDLLIGALAFYAGGGGLDGDGGGPDIDIPLLGIGAHRSVFTHSIVAGAVVETALYSLIDFIGVAYRYLPEGHDQRWALIHDRLGRAATASAKGASLGLAYHLGVDGVVQPGAYHGLPFEMPMAGHQAILTANAIAEALDIPLKEYAGSTARAGGQTRVSNKLKGVVAGAGALAAWVLAEFV
jgi:hypothetical protein